MRLCNRLPQQTLHLPLLELNVAVCTLKETGEKKKKNQDQNPTLTHRGFFPEMKRGKINRV